MIVALGACSVALLLLGWSVMRLSTSIERQADAVEAHGTQLAKFGRAVYGSGSRADSNLTVADAAAAEQAACSEDARPSGPTP